MSGGVDLEARATARRRSAGRDGRYVDASAVVAEMRRQKMVPNPGG